MDLHELERDLEAGRSLVSAAKRIVVLTGAGISAESGVPTFRGPEGVWRHDRPEELSTPAAFARDPRLVWEWNAWRRERIVRCEPNAAHLALAAWALRRPGVRILTQNVDGLHGIAAVMVAGDRPPTPALPLELHGSIFHVRCTLCRTRIEHRDKIDVSSEASLPRCSDCGALLRPDTVWFGEPLDPDAIHQAFDEAAKADLCLVIGTSGEVQPTATLPRVTQANGGAVIEINPEPTPLSAHAEISLRASATSAVPALVGGPNFSRNA